MTYRFAIGLSDRGSYAALLKRDIHCNVGENLIILAILQHNCHYQ